MCGRYQFTEPQNADLRRILQDVRRRCGDRAQGFALRPACNKPPAAVCHDLRLTMGFFRPFQVGCFLYGGFGYLVVR